MCFTYVSEIPITEAFNDFEKYLILELEYHNIGIDKFGGCDLSVMRAFVL